MFVMYYEYQLKLASYTGWKYTYVTGSWADLMQMLIEGKIDLMSDVSYTEERSELMLFPELPMGMEEYYIYVAPNNEEISSDTLSTLNGKKIGINKDSVMIGLFETWAEANGVKAEITELTDTVSEALVRWRHHELGLIPPGDFIPRFEQNGQVSEIDRFVWEEVASQIARWKDKYGVTVPVSVNLSRVDIYDPLLESRLDELLEKNGLDRGALSLEVTESAYTENSDEVINVIERLRKNGYEIEMDDFGTGYSSLNLLSSLPVNALKTDREFIKNIGRNEKDDHMIEVILDIAKEINVPVIAEGVETEEQLKLLKKLGCELVQGFYFSRPLPPHEFETAYLKIN